MKKQTVKAIIEASEDLGLELERDNDYSGRGMYGASTEGVEGNFRSFVAAVAQAAKGLKGDAHSEFVRDLENLRIDNMGLDYIFY